MEEYKQIIIIRTDLGMSRGKLAAQTAHAAVEALEKTKKMKPEWVKRWNEGGPKGNHTKVVLRVESKEELLEWKAKLEKEFPVALIKDAGLTEITPGTLTALGVGPCPESLLDEYTKELKLL